MKIALVIMAAGLGSRFGTGIKQLTAVGPNKEIIIDYSIHDAIEAGFNKIIFIIRKDIEKDFMEVIGNRITKMCDDLGVEVDIVFQEKDDLPEGYEVPEGRVKPWGTGQAVLAARDVIHEPFAVINADDYYGKEAYKKMADFLRQYNPDKPFELSMAGFVLKNTLSDFGAVTRGLCRVDQNGFLTKIKETKNIIKTKSGAKSGEDAIDANIPVSMNMWGFTPEFIPVLEKGFEQFLEKNKDNIIQCEFLLPIFIGELLEKNAVSVKVLNTGDKWFGVTYIEDTEPVVKSFLELTKKGFYDAKNIFSDLKRIK